MSGIIIIINTNGEPVDRDQLWSLTQYMRYRGPDEQRVWQHGPVGLGHAMLRTTDAITNESQPATLDSRFWIVADARIDDQDTLRRRLESQGRTLDGSENDVALILHAFAVWGDDCVNHLLGDFAFVIWDEAERRLFAARDHFGVKPLYFTQLSNHLLLSNTLNCLRMHPAVSDGLNRDAIMSYLRLGYNETLFTTTFEDIQRLPHAHVLRWSENRLSLSRYWDVPVEEPLAYKRPQDYVEHFRSILTSAVLDRLRTEKLALLMSGGMDSTAIAAIVTSETLNPRHDRHELRAFTGVYRSSIAYDEEPWAKLVAEYLGLDIQWLVFDLPPLFAHWNTMTWNTVEPSDGLMANRFYLHDGNIPEFSRVGLFGYGADAILYPSETYLLSLAKRGQFGRLLGDLGHYYRLRGRLPPPYIRSNLKRRFRGPAPGTVTTLPFSLPDSVPFDYESALHSPQPHPWRPEAATRLRSAGWPRLLESYDPGITGLRFEARNPFFDVRLVDYALRLPAVPWCVQKEVLRQATDGLLPKRVVKRLKQPMRADPYAYALGRDEDLRWVERLREVSMISEFVDVELTIDAVRHYNSAKRGGKEQQVGLDTELLLRPYALALWLKNLGSYRRFSPGGEVV